MSISMLKALPNLYAGKKVKKLINQQHAKLRRKPYINQILKVKKPTYLSREEGL